jgi:hypothetical protein
LPQNPDNFDIIPPAYHAPTHPKMTIDKYMTKSHYNRAVNRTPPATGKAPGPDALTNELVKDLREEVHTLIYTLFQTTAKHSYTSKEWCKRTTCLLCKK